MAAGPVLETNWMASIVGLMVALGVICGIKISSSKVKGTETKE
jgi:hypothetical protein